VREKKNVIVMVIISIWLLPGQR